MTYAQRYIKVISWLVLHAYCVQFLSGCANRAPIKLDPPPPLAQSKKSDLAVTLIDSRDRAEDPFICVNGGCVGIDSQNSIFDLINGGLSSAYSKVEISGEGNLGNPLYAQASVISRKSDLSADVGLSTTVKINLYRADTRELLKRISFTRQTPVTTNFNGALVAVELAGILTLVLAPFVVQMRQSRAREVVEKAYKQHLTELTDDIKKNISENLIVSINAQDQAPHSGDVFLRTNHVNKSVRDSSLAQAEKCKSDIQWKVGKAEERISCMNKAWNDYTIFVETYVDEFKSFRLNLAKQVDAGKLSLEEYEAQENNAREKLIWHSTLTDGFKKAEAAQDSGAVTPNKDTQDSNGSALSNKFADALTSVLGFAFRVAIVAAPYALGYLTGVRAATPAIAPTGTTIPKSNCRMVGTNPATGYTGGVPSNQLICTP